MGLSQYMFIIIFVALSPLDNDYLARSIAALMIFFPLLVQGHF